MKSKPIYELTPKRAFILILAILLIDQISKFYIKLNYPITIYSDDAIINWRFFKILFVENKGMAMGARLENIIPFLNEKNAKLILTLFRLVAIGAIGLWMKKLFKNSSSVHLKWALCLIIAGAIGNIIDSVFYGVIFSDSYGQVATLLPKIGYAPLFYGNVVDMIQFPLFEWTWPSWIPFIGGQDYLFFQYIFNIADSSITFGAAIIIFFNKKIFIEN